MAMQQFANDMSSKRRIPRTSIDRLAADAVPGVQLHGDTREALAECAMEFVQLVADAAQAKCSAAGRVQLNAADTLAALDELGFGKYRASAEAAAAVSSFESTGGSEAGTAARTPASGVAKGAGRKKRERAAAGGASSKASGSKGSGGAASASAQYRRLKHSKLSEEEQRELAEEQRKLFAAAAEANSGK